ncbi:pyruvate dehydrogenase (acetyl-transferring) E1 component subunit alpha [Galactobacter valiniphilus]|uniref:2-oxoisovalerate dehydrogenase subunit alpha n=1 Tax=Galactobacter valiniphilus TaxID=2676122 RepID=A0A399J6W5_9MICC|nr:thiamine pyrophosphate-dependent enzyme [Galactobacter valiniphilus]RII41211.1 pyruvate dehydrogenase (acetyl-transferring) E1 component subunit alpha [Galactobacter valiniphilus]
MALAPSERNANSPYPEDSAQNCPSTLSLLSPEGVRVTTGPDAARVADIDDTALAALYAKMVVQRRIDAEGTALQRQGQLALWAPSKGQEAAQIGAAEAFRDDDFIFPTYRDHGVIHSRGVAPSEVMRQWRGASHGGWDPHEKHMAPVQIIIGAQTLHAVGYAMGAAFDGQGGAAVAFLGDGATSQGDVNEAMVFAASFNAPVLFFLENNQFAISEPVTLQSRTPLVDRPRGFGIRAVRVDGNDVLAVLSATRDALARIDAGEGPQFIEAVTYRRGAHTTADDPSRYRDTELESYWEKLDPIDRVEAHLRSRGVDVDAVLAEAGTEADGVAAELRAAVISMQEDDPELLFAHVYSEPHPRIAEQREEYLGYLAETGGSAA